MICCALCGHQANCGLVTSRSMQDRLPVSEEGFTYLHAVLNILSAAECYDGELAVDGQLCDSCADSLEQLEQLQNQVRDLVEFLLAGYQQRCRHALNAQEKQDKVKEEEEKQSGSGSVPPARRKRSARKSSGSVAAVVSRDDSRDSITEDRKSVKDEVPVPVVTTSSAEVASVLLSNNDDDVTAGDIKKDVKDEVDGDDASMPMVECVTQLTVRRGRCSGRDRNRGSSKSRRKVGTGTTVRKKRAVGVADGDKPRKKVAPYVARIRPDRILSRCDLCGETFLSGLILLRHIEQTHGEEEAARVTTCDICHYRLKTQRMLARHKFKVHGVEVPFGCSNCDIELKSEAEYTKHMRQRHMDTAVCELCGKECYSRYQLGFHVRQLHGDQMERYICEVCSQVCKGKGSLRMHMRRHSAVNAVQCQLCERSFKWESSLVSHIQAAHNVTGPTYPCDLCERVFKDKNNQKKHRFTHTTVKPYQCEECGKGFIRRDFFTKHRCAGNLSSQAVNSN